MVRHKNRYLVVQLQPENTNDQNLILKNASLYNKILEKLQLLHGDYGVAATRASFVSKYCNEKTRIAVIKCRHGPHRLVASCLPFIRMIEDKPVVLNLLYMGATIRKCFKFVRNYQQRKFDEFCVDLKTDQEKIALKNALMNFDSVLSLN